MPSEIDETYMDEFGMISTIVYVEAEKIRPKALNFALRLLQDEHLGEDFLSKASANVTRVLEKDATYIKDLQAFLRRTYRRLVLAEAKKRKRQGELEENRIGELTNIFEQLPRTAEDKMEHQILIREITEKMDDWTREVFKLRMLGHEYRELVPEFGTAENVIRSKMSKKIKALARKINPQS